jgi:tetratricopeptide (TPR) repeat protein
MLRQQEEGGMMVRLWATGLVLIACVCPGPIWAQQAAVSVDPQIEQAIVAGDWQKLAELCSAWQEREPKSPLAAYLGSEAYGRQNRPDLSSRIVAPMFEATYKAPESLPPCAAWARRLAARHARVSAAWGLLADLLGYAEEYQASVEAGERAVALGPRDPSAYVDRGWAYYWVDDGERAIADLTRAIELRADHAEAYRCRGDVYTWLGEYEKALADYDRAIELAPEYGAAYYGRGEVREYRRELDLAIADLTRAIELEPWFTWSYEMRGIAHYRKLDYEGALGDFAKYLELDPDEALLWLYKARACRQLGRTDEAVEALREFIELAPGNGLAWRIPEARALIRELGGEP